MKLRYLLISLFSGACITFSSCSADWLNLSPATSVPSDEIKTLEDAQFALNGIYRETSQHSYYGDNYWYYGDCRGTDVQARITGKTRVVPYYMFYVQATDNFNVTLPWNRPYLVIRQANNLIQRIDNHEIESGDTQALNQMKAEALSLRALALFSLTRMFGMPYTNDNGTSLGVPIVLKPEQPDYQPERNTVAECYDQVISDLTTALSLGIGKEKKDGHFNYWGVQALLSR
ncbi:MAG: RagB/SusD family nutrient uptake outer membrane protein, partial [Bacteroides sp.]|nr:RagB/SusD family nutrient uptake outer membrane protein [Bacteroides sp.]